MHLNPQRIATREKLILAGLFLSKYDAVGLKKLGFGSFLEAFNVIGYALGSKPASIKNYRDEFDPLLPNRRKGWHKRATRDYCLNVFEEYKSLDLETFSALVKSFVGYDENIWSEVREKEEKPDGESNFAKRLITGLAAERYFEPNPCRRKGVGQTRRRREARRNLVAINTLKGARLRRPVCSAKLCVLCVLCVAPRLLTA